MSQLLITGFISRLSYNTRSIWYSSHISVGLLIYKSYHITYLQCHILGDKLVSPSMAFEVLRKVSDSAACTCAINSNIEIFGFPFITVSWPNSRNPCHKRHTNKMQRWYKTQKKPYNRGTPGPPFRKTFNARLTGPVEDGGLRWGCLHVAWIGAWVWRVCIWEVDISTRF
jgi:hypothetical protein